MAFGFFKNIISWTEIITVYSQCLDDRAQETWGTWLTAENNNNKSTEITVTLLNMKNGYGFSAVHVYNVIQYGDHL